MTEQSPSTASSERNDDVIIAIRSAEQHLLANAQAGSREEMDEEEQEEQSALLTDDESQTRAIPLDDLQVWSELAEGASSTVLTASLAGERDRVCVKRFRQTGAGDFVERWKEEYTSLVRLRHPQISEIIGVCVSESPFRGEDHFGLGIVLKRYAATLQAHLGDLTHNNIISVARDAACALTHLHLHGYMHRDFKSSNILLDFSPGSISAVLADLGSASHVAAPTKSSSTRRTGTLLYAAPELLRCERHGVEVDVWSYGIVLWELAMGLTAWEIYMGTRSIEKTVTPFEALGWRPDRDVKSLKGLSDVEARTLIQLATPCFSPAPADRPHATALLHRLTMLLDSRERVDLESPRPLHRSTSPQDPGQRAAPIRTQPKPVADPPYVPMNNGGPPSFNDDHRRRFSRAWGAWFGDVEDLDPGLEV